VAPDTNGGQHTITAGVLWQCDPFEKPPSRFRREHLQAQRVKIKRSFE